MSREVMQQALEALETFQKISDFTPAQAVHAIVALREALATCERCGKKLGGPDHIHTCTPTRQSEWDNIPQNFRDWWNVDYDDSSNPFRLASSAYWAWAGWQEAQPAQQPLTDEQIKSVIASIDPDEQYMPKALRQFARAIEAAHGITGEKK